MTAITKFEDIIAAMDSNPEWLEAMRSRLLTRELVQLPARFEELSRENSLRLAASEAKLDELSELVKITNRRLDRLEAKTDDLSELVRITNRRLDRLEAKTDDLSELVKIAHERLDRLEAKTDDLSELVRVAHERLDRLEAKTDDLSELVKITNRRLDRLEAKTDDLSELVKVAHERLDRVDKRLDRVDKRLDRVDKRLDSLEELVKVVSRQVEVNTEHLKRNTAHLDRMRGFEIERQLYRRIHGLMRASYRLYDCRVLRTGVVRVAVNRLYRDVNAARRRGEIKDSEYDRLFDTDLIAVGKEDEAESRTYFVAEASYHVNKDDIDRVIVSREAMSSVYSDSDTVASVFGVSISDEDLYHARSNGVAMIQAHLE